MTPKIAFLGRFVKSMRIWDHIVKGPQINYTVLFLEKSLQRWYQPWSFSIAFIRTLRTIINNEFKFHFHQQQ